MKHYVKEFPNDVLNRDKENILKGLITAYLEDYESGLITDVEAIYMISTLVY